MRTPRENGMNATDASRYAVKTVALVINFVFFVPLLLMVDARTQRRLGASPVSNPMPSL